MLKKISVITALALVSASTLFWASLSATSGTYVAETVHYGSGYCPDNMTSKHSSSFKGGTVYYGCVGRNKPYTEYKKNTSQDYQAITTTPNGTRKGNIKDNNVLSRQAEHSISKGGTVYHKVRFY